MGLINSLSLIAVIFAVLMVPISVAAQTRNVVEVVDGRIQVTRAEPGQTPIQPGKHLIWITSDSSEAISAAAMLTKLTSNPSVVGLAESPTRPNNFVDPTSKQEVGGDPTLILLIWTPGSSIPACASEKILPVGDTYLFKDSANQIYLGGAGFYMDCGTDGTGAQIVLLAGNSIEALRAVAEDYASSNLITPKDVQYYVSDEKLNTFFVTLGNKFTGEKWVESYGGDPVRAIHNGYGMSSLASSLRNLAPGGNLVVMGKADHYLSGAYEGSLAHILYGELLSQSGNSLHKTNIYACQGEEKPVDHTIPAGFPVFVQNGTIMASDYSCSGLPSKESLSDYGVYYSTGNKLLIAGLSTDAVSDMIGTRRAPTGKEIPSCSGFSCNSGCICAGVSSCSGGVDLDKDGYTVEQGDCDDCPYDDNNIDEYPCPTQEYLLDKIKEDPEKWCFEDSNNNGIGDRAACAPCRNPGMTERCDDVDNDCMGRCQGSTTTICYVEDYSGDGAIELGGDCAGVTNRWGVKDNFCQMVDDNVKVDDETCAGYNRCVNWARDYAFMGNKNKVNIFAPAGAYVDYDDSGMLQQVRQFYGHAECYSKLIDSSGEETIFDCRPGLELAGKSRGTEDLPLQYIDSMRGELDFDDFWSSLPDSERERLEWETACVPKDKCADGVDNNGEDDIFETVPYAYYVMEVEDMFSVETGESIPINNDFEMRFTDVDDPQCKFKQEYSSLFGYPAHGKPTSEMYLENPATNFPYCLDQDSDGFCGRPMKGEVTYGTEKITVGGGTNIVSADVPIETKNRVYDEEAGSKYVLPRQFMDCDDEPGAVTYMVNAEPLIASPKYGWPGQREGDYISAWHVHPFSPVNKYHCNLMYYDFNCNKGGEDGYNLPLLKESKTPFDWDLQTGKEWAYATTFKKPQDQDLVCHTKTTLQMGLQTTERRLGYVVMGGLAIGALATGVGFFAGAAGILAAGKVILLGTGYLGIGLTTVDAIACANVLDWRNVDWKAVKIHCVGVAIDATLTVVSFGLSRVAKARLAVSSADDVIVPVQKTLDDVPTERIGRVARESLDDVATGPKGGCFLAGTQIMLADSSYVNIEDISLGDYVMAYDLEKDCPANATVTATFVRNATEYLIIEYEPI